MKTTSYYTLLATLTIFSFSSLASGRDYSDIDQNNRSGLFSNIINSIETSVLLEEELMIETDKGHTQKLETLIHPEIEAKLPFDFDFTAIGRFRLDAVDNLEHGDSSQPEISPASRRGIVGDRIEFELREFFFEKTINNVYLKLGKQQIVWGNADGLKVLDVVNPQDFREFIYDEWEDSRIPLWTVNVEIPINDWLIQLLWIPDRTYHKIPEPNSTFEFTSPMIIGNPPPNLPLNQNSVQRPQRFFSDSDAGIRLSRFWKGWDFTFNYLYHFDDIPVAFSDVAITRGRPLITVSPEYKRSHLIGGTFSNAFGNLVIRGEYGYFFNKYFVVNDLANSDGVVETDKFSYVLGFDWSGLSDTLLSFQLFQGIITDSPPGLIRDQVETNVSLYVSREFLNNVIHAEFIWLQNINRSDGFFRPKISYELKDNVMLKLGFDLFYGANKGIFGQFDNNDRIALGIEVDL
ncbi:MAG: DUF1302 family protein [Candidatus Anammoxibacter sp.]